MKRSLLVALAAIAIPALASQAESGGPKLSGAELASGGDAGVAVYRGGRAETGQACQPVTGAHGVTVFSGCNRALDDELAGGPQARLASVKVSAVRKGHCARDIYRPNRSGSGVYTVCYSDLQPVYGGRIDDLYRRITRAAGRACTRGAGYGAARRHAGCEAQAIDLAVYDTALPALIDHHSREIARRSPEFAGSRR